MEPAEKAIGKVARFTESLSPGHCPGMIEWCAAGFYEGLRGDSQRLSAL